MAPLSTETPPLTLSEQLDAMLLGWLERHAERPSSSRPDHRAKAVVTVAAGSIEEVEAFCAKWAMTLTSSPSGECWAVLVVEGPALPIQGFAEITRMYRR
jgi:hypothetical protein